MTMSQGPAVTDVQDLIADLDDEQRIRQPRDTGWEYMGRMLANPVSLDKIMAEAVANGIPDNGGWEMMLPGFITPAGLVLIFKRPKNRLIVARGTVPPFEGVPK